MLTDIADVWLIGLDVPDEPLARLAETLSDAERERAALFTAAGRRGFVAAHGAVRVILGGLLGVRPERIGWRTAGDGKPAVTGPDRTERGGVEVSMSSSGRYAALAVTSRRPVGVDVQQWPMVTDPVLVAERFWPPGEARLVAAGDRAAQAARLTRLWTRKEACVKAAGGRLMQGMKLPVAGPGPVIVRDPGGALPGPFLVQDVPVPGGFHAAVAVTGAQACRLRVHQWPSGHERAAEDRPVATGTRPFSDLSVGAAPLWKTDARSSRRFTPSFR